MEKDLGRIRKNDETEIVVRVDDFGGRPGLTIREFVTSDRYTGFTKSGTRILAEDFETFKQMINSIDPNDLKPAAQESLPDSGGPDSPAGSESKADTASGIDEDGLM